MDELGRHEVDLRARLQKSQEDEIINIFKPPSRKHCNAFSFFLAFFSSSVEGEPWKILEIFFLARLAFSSHPSPTPHSIIHERWWQQRTFLSPRTRDTLERMILITRSSHEASPTLFPLFFLLFCRFYWIIDVEQQPSTHWNFFSSLANVVSHNKRKKLAQKSIAPWTFKNR